MTVVAAWCDRVAGGVRAGSSLTQAVVDAGTEPGAPFDHVAHALRRGRPLAAAFRDDPATRHTAGRARRARGGDVRRGRRPGGSRSNVSRPRCSPAPPSATSAGRASAQARLSARVLTVLPLGVLGAAGRAEPSIRARSPRPPAPSASSPARRSTSVGWWWMRRMIGGRIVTSSIAGVRRRCCTLVLVLVLGTLGRRPVRRARPPRPTCDAAVGATRRRRTPLVLAAPCSLVSRIGGRRTAAGRRRRRRGRAADRRRAGAARPAGSAPSKRPMPDAVELLVLCIHAGCSPTQAVVGRRGASATCRSGRCSPTSSSACTAATASPPPSARWRRPGPRAGRSRRPSRRPIGTALALAPVLDRLAGEARAARRRLAEADARRLPVRLTFPLVACTLPRSCSSPSRRPCSAPSRRCGRPPRERPPPRRREEPPVHPDLLGARRPRPDRHHVRHHPTPRRHRAAVARGDAVRRRPSTPSSCSPPRWWRSSSSAGPRRAAARRRSAGCSTGSSTR